MPRAKDELVSRTVRLPRPLNRLVEAVAEQRGVSANHLIVQAVREHVPRRPISVTDQELDDLLRETDDLLAQGKTGVTPTMARLIERSYGA
jgi:hypothetical protein